MDLGNCNPFLRKNTKSGISETLSCETTHNEIRRVKTMVGDENTEKEERRSMYDREKRKEIFLSFPEKEAGKRLDTLPFGSYNKSEAVPQEQKEEAVSARGCIKYRKARLQWGGWI